MSADLVARRELEKGEESTETVEDEEEAAPEGIIEAVENIEKPNTDETDTE